MVRVLVAEDMRILRDTLVAVLDLEDDLDVIAAVATGAASFPQRWNTVPTWRCWTSTCQSSTGLPPPTSCTRRSPAAAFGLDRDGDGIGCES